MNDKHRYISVSFWDDEWIQSLDPSEKFLYMYYMTNPLTNIAGVYKITAKRVSFDTGFTIDTINHIMEKFQAVGKAFRFGEWIILTRWTNHQKISENDNNRKGIDKILKELPDDIFSFLVQNGYKYKYLNELGRPLQGASMTLNYSNININSNLNSNLNNNANTPPVSPSEIDNEHSKPKRSSSKKKEYSDDFLTFWEAYPKKQSKDQAYKEYKSQINAGRTIEDIIAKLDIYKLQIRKNKVEEKYIRYPSTFLHNLDDYSPENACHSQSSFPTETDAEREAKQAIVDSMMG